MKIKDLPEGSKPRERFVKYGPKSLSDAELFAIILRTGSKQENVIEVANRLIAKYGLENIFDCSIKELKKIKGIGQTKAIELLAIAELIKRGSKHKKEIKHVSSAKDIFEIYHKKLENEKQENFFVLMLNNHNNIVAEEAVFKGTLDSAVVHPREVFKPAIKNSAAKIILVHNHPSGNSDLSSEDKQITKALTRSGALLGIGVLDHIIIGKDSYWSWKEKNRGKQ